jgi:lincosamide nucleotidyltransferase A/C/D/E
VISADDLLEIVGRLEQFRVRLWLEGGWGVDALLGEQTRDHDDLDLAIAHDDLERCFDLLAEFARDAERSDPPASYVVRDSADRRVDLHPIVLDEYGNGWQRAGKDRWWLYPAAGLSATGNVSGRELPCISAELQVRHHLGYELDTADRRDLGLLAERFGVALPPAD